MIMAQNMSHFMLNQVLAVSLHGAFEGFRDILPVFIIDVNVKRFFSHVRDTEIAQIPLWEPFAHFLPILQMQNHISRLVILYEHERVSVSDPSTLVVQRVYDKFPF